MINYNNILKDHYYSALLKEHGEAYVRKAGYFEDETRNNCLSDEQLMETLKVPCTPLKNMEEYHKPGAVVLLTTGCFNPVHIDHLAMLYEARMKLSALGLRVVQVFMAPDSDTYCAQKGDYYPFFHRAAKIKQLAAEHNEDIDVDMFPSLQNMDLNFTTIYRRLELYIEHFTGAKVPIYYVCGSDNAEFSFAFGGQSVVVQREGYETKGTHPYAIRVIPSRPLRHSSTEYRKLGLEHAAQQNLIIRSDSNFPTETFEKYFNSVYSHNMRIPLEENVISLDSMTVLKYNLQLSRAFALGGVKQLGFTNRPGSPTLEAQLENIPAGRYFLFDDDVFTGKTIEYATTLLESRGVRIMGHKTLFTSNRKFEVLDARDFRFGINSGLCVRFPDGEEYRVPYLFPFVDLWQRASIRKPIHFSREIWNNIATYAAKLPIGRTIRGKVYVKLGFDPQTTFQEVAKYYERICEQAL